ncbi:MAG TPA: DNA repair protein RecN [Candidatus Binatia bacterium]|jgi:DNA repair protein RecN (Recombination protein N)
MLRGLKIKNFAVIDEVALDLAAGLNVLTGETGAGKTIVLNALALISGGRVSADIIRHGEEEASVEALFESFPAALKEKLRDGGHEIDDDLVIKRVVSRSGKNRIYLNGGLCPLGLLSEIGPSLIHIYGQHEHQTLLRPESHLELLDDYGGLSEKAAAMSGRYAALAAAWSDLSRAKELLDKRRREEEWLRAQAEEIARARLQPGEEEELKERRNILMHAEKLFQGCKEGEELLYEGDEAVAGRLGRYVARLKELARIDSGLNAAVELLDSAQAQLQEGASFLRRHTDRVQFDPAAQEQLEERLAEIGRLKRKYQGSIEEILKHGEKIAEELKGLERGEEEIPALEASSEKARRAAWEFAEALSRERKKAAAKFKKEMEKEVATLGMAGTVFDARFLEPGAMGESSPFVADGRILTEQGIDQVEFYFSPNPGEPVKPLAKIASGGELSRLMLAIKSLVLGRGDIPTLLFDEVDAGIGGRVAEIVGQKLKKVAALHQVLCVTHLPQIAALADSHYVVRKEVAKGRTFTEVGRLGERDRVAEVARMLGGVKVTEKAIRHAEEMVKGRIKAEG